MIPPRELVADANVTTDVLRLLNLDLAVLNLKCEGESACTQQLKF